MFGDAVTDVGGVRQTRVGCGIHAFRDPTLTEDFDTVPLRVDVAEEHRYAVDWTPGGVDFLLDGVVTRRSAESPDYPLQLILGVFDFPGTKGPDGATTFVPELVVSRVRWEPAESD